VVFVLDAAVSNDGPLKGVNGKVSILPLAVPIVLVDRSRKESHFYLVISQFVWVNLWCGLLLTLVRFWYPYMS
jgi:hypothetical protein